MLEKQTVSKGVRLTPTQSAKLDQLAATLRISRNRVFGVLLDCAELKSTPSVSVGLGKKTSRATEREDRIV